MNAHLYSFSSAMQIHCKRGNYGTKLYSGILRLDLIHKPTSSSFGMTPDHICDSGFPSNVVRRFCNLIQWFVYSSLKSSDGLFCSIFQGDIALAPGRVELFGCTYYVVGQLGLKNK